MEHNAKRARQEQRHVLFTGGAGYIGSHTLLEFIEAQEKSDNHMIPVVVDNLCNSVYGADGHGIAPESVKRVSQLVGREVLFHRVDVLDKAALSDVFDKYNVHAVIHFAALKAVGESTTIPLKYYRVNISGTINLLEVMEEHGVRNILFSSSATVYGEPECLPITESHPVGRCTNTYGKTKFFIEEILKDQCAAKKDWSAVVLRYFNPIGAHISGQIGEDPKGKPNNLMPYISQVAVGRRDQLSVFGNDYKTHDGTGVRDYIHVVDLAQGHVAALKVFDNPEKIGWHVYNLGTGQGYSVLEMVRAMEAASGKPIPYEVVARRPGDVATVYGDPSKAEKELGWKAKRTLQQMCEDSWRWQSQNPEGFSEAM